MRNGRIKRTKVHINSCEPMVGHAAEVGQIVACDFRPSNASPSRGNLEFIQRKRIKGQGELDLDAADTGEQIVSQGYIYHFIATNQDDWSNRQIIHWYNQRAEDSENRIKELKRDFGGDTLPCSDFNANALYFLISALSFNLFALMRQLLPEDLASHRAMTIRWRLYAIAAKVVKTGDNFL